MNSCVELDASFSHVWMVRAFLKHSDEAEDDEELCEVHRTLYDVMHALGPSLEAGNAASYLKQVRKKLSKLLWAAQFFREIQPEVSQHMNFPHGRSIADRGGGGNPRLAAARVGEPDRVAAGASMRVPVGAQRVGQSLQDAPHRPHVEIGLLIVGRQRRTDAQHLAGQRPEKMERLAPARRPDNRPRHRRWPRRRPSVARPPGTRRPTRILRRARARTSPVSFSATSPAPRPAQRLALHQHVGLELVQRGQHGRAGQRIGAPGIGTFAVVQRGRRRRPGRPRR